jgi:hypothetical protein
VGTAGWVTSSQASSGTITVAGSTTIPQSTLTATSISSSSTN